MENIYRIYDKMECKVINDLYFDNKKECIDMVRKLNLGENYNRYIDLEL